MNEISRFFIGHMVCVSQWAAFLLVDRAYLGKGRVKHVGFWSVVLVAGMLAFSLIFQIGFFTLETVWYNVGYVLLSTLLFGGTLPPKPTRRKSISGCGKRRRNCCCPFATGSGRI